MPILLSGIVIAAMIFYLFNCVTVTSLKRSLKIFVGSIVFSALTCVLLGFFLVIW